VRSIGKGLRDKNGVDGEAEGLVLSHEGLMNSDGIAPSKRFVKKGERDLVVQLGGGCKQEGRRSRSNVSPVGRRVAIPSPNGGVRVQDGREVLRGGKGCSRMLMYYSLKKSKKEIY